MKHKSIITLIIGTLLTLPSWGADNEIDLHKKGESQTGSRNITAEYISAYISNKTLLYITYNDVIPSRITLREPSSNNIVWDYENPANNSIMVNLESLPNGIYIIEIYAFDQCWTGYIEIEE